MTDDLREAARGVSEATVISADKELSEKPDEPAGPVGLDIGTCNIVMSQKKGSTVESKRQLNAFFTVPYIQFAVDILNKNKVDYFADDGQLYIIGNAAEKFSVMFGAQTRRPMHEGLLNSQEEKGQKVIEKTIQTLIEKPRTLGESICMSLPAAPVDAPEKLIYHEAIMKNFLIGMGYRVKCINEGLAVILSELSDNNFTGIGVSIGGGMCNVCLSYLSLPIFSFCVLKAGDYIDTSVAGVMNMVPTNVKIAKETDLDLRRSPRSRLENAFHIFYNEIIHNLISSLDKRMRDEKKMPTSLTALPMVLAGGTVCPNGFLEQFEKVLAEYNLPIRISDIRVAQDPLTSTVKGALIAAMSEEGTFGRMDG